MNKKKLHSLLVKKKKERDFDSSYWNLNCVRLPDDPSKTIDCTPDGNYENFKGLVYGDGFYYSEPNNSTPIQEDYRIRKEDMRLPRLLCHSRIVFDEQGIDSISRQIIGMDIRCNDAATISCVRVGLVTGAWASRIRKSSKYLTLSVVFKLYEKKYDKLKGQMDHARLYLGLYNSKSRFFCCECGNEIKDKDFKTCELCCQDCYAFCENPIISDIFLL